MHIMAYNGSQVNIAENCRKLATMGFRAFLVMDNTVVRQAMARNGRKWQEMGCRGYLVEHGVFACFVV